MLRRQEQAQREQAVIRRALEKRARDIRYGIYASMGFDVFPNRSLANEPFIATTARFVDDPVDDDFYERD